MRALPLALALSVAGCAYTGSARDFDPEEIRASSGWSALQNVPVHLQEQELDCGIAALAMILEYWGVPDAADRAKTSCPIVEERGARARDLRDCARAAGLTSYLLHGSWNDLERELALGHPLVVGLVKTGPAGIFTHYEVVVGLNREARLLVTLDPAHGWRQNSVDGFLTEWERSACLLLVFFDASGT